MEFHKVRSDPTPNGRGVEDTPSAAVLTIPALATYLQLPVSTIYRLAERGDLPGHKVGRQWRFHKTAVDAWFRARAVTRRVTILVVGDEPTVRDLIVTTLRSGPRQILSAASGEDALRTHQTTPLDLVLLDLVMPAGVDTFRQLRAHRADLPVLIVADSPASTLMTQALEIGPFAVLAKPIAIDQLQQTVDRMLRP